MDFPGNTYLSLPLSSGLGELLIDPIIGQCLIHRIRCKDELDVVDKNQNVHTNLSESSQVAALITFSSMLIEAHAANY